MAKQTKAQSFSKANIFFEDDRFMIEERDKDEVRVYDLTDVLKEWEGVEGVSLTIKQDASIDPYIGG